MKVAELSGAMLDYWMARAEGYRQNQIDISDEKCFVSGRPGSEDGYVYLKRYSTSWRDGGYLIEKYSICLDYISASTWWAEPRYCLTKIENHKIESCEMTRGIGETALIAVCRCIVASIYGDEVPDE